MKSYNPDDGKGMHTIRVTIQCLEYTGHLTEKVGGYCKGRNVLDFDFNDEISSFSENDCKLEYDDIGWYRCMLKNPEGEEKEIEASPDEMNDMIVAIEIVDFQEDKQ